MTAKPKCGYCGHAAHRRACRAKAPSRCVPAEAAPGAAHCAAAGPRPPCPCPWQVCKCGLLVSVAALDGTGRGAAFGRLPADGGGLAVRLLPDGSVACRELGPGGTLAAGEWRAREHVAWPDHGPVAAQRAPRAAPRRPGGDL